MVSIWETVLLWVSKGGRPNSRKQARNGENHEEREWCHLGFAYELPDL